MPRQSVVTNYFSCKRQRAFQESSKHKISDTYAFDKLKLQAKVKDKQNLERKISTRATCSVQKNLKLTEKTLDIEKKTNGDGTSMLPSETSPPSQSAAKVTFSGKHRMSDVTEPQLKKRKLDSYEHVGSQTDQEINNNAPISFKVQHGIDKTSPSTPGPPKKKTLKDLQDSLLKIRQLKKEEKTLRCARLLKEKCIVTQNDRNKTKTNFAHDKYESLAKEVPSGLSLPKKYKKLLEMFRNLDMITSMLFNRQETITWAKVQKSVKDTINGNFDQLHLKQIKHTFPEAYHYRQEKDIPTFSDAIKKSDYQLTIEPLLDENASSLKGKKLTSSMLVRRRHYFHVQLLEIVKRYHQEFLSKLNEPIAVDDDRLRHWHAQFPLERVPDIPTSELPLPPDASEQKCHSAKEVLDTVGDRLTKKATEALRKVADRFESPVHNANTTEDSCSSTGKTKNEIKGISSSLLQKIRAKEANRKLKEMVRSDKQADKINKLRNLPSLARSLKTLYVRERRTSLFLAEICRNLVASCPSITTQDSMEAHLHLLASSMPSWFRITQADNKEYGKLKKDEGISGVIAQLQKLIIQAEKE